MEHIDNIIQKIDEEIDGRVGLMANIPDTSQQYQAYMNQIEGLLRARRIVVSYQKEEVLDEGRE